jgi:hypothetical protein
MQWAMGLHQSVVFKKQHVQTTILVTQDESASEGWQNFEPFSFKT